MNVVELRRAFALTSLAVGVLIAPSCGAGNPDAGVENDTTASFARPGATDPGRFFAELEDSLLRRPESRIGFRITADGAFTADLEGELYIGTGNEITLDSRGTFGADSVSLSLTAADGRLIGGNGGRTFEEPVPADLREAIVIGLTRMGLLHNLARLVSGSPPDRADGGVRRWVKAAEFDWSAPDSVIGGPSLSFQVRVDEQPAGDAVLWIDAQGRPVAREQTVRFPDGEMRVREEYEIR